MKITFIVGTRPEIIKMSPLIDEVEKRGIDYILIHTGQHYDQEMSEQFFSDLELSQPDYNIGVGSKSHGKQTAVMLEGIEKILLSENPDIILVEGDTNAVMAGAIAASKLHLPIGHVEAGLRSFDKTMPEEINRLIADVCSNLFFVPTEESAINLIFEGLNPHNIFITGNTVVDACLRNLKIAGKSSKNKFNLEKNLVTLTIHRAENVDDPHRLKNITDALLELDDATIIFPVHPRTRKNLEKFGIYHALEEAEHIQMMKPVGYLDFLVLLSQSKLVLTDSGGIQEEAVTLNIPCITLRYNTERPETVASGGNVLVGAHKESIIDNARRIMHDAELYQEMCQAVNPYGDGKASERIIDAILKSHKDGKMHVEPPENIKGHDGWYLEKIDKNTTVSEFEANNKLFVIKAVFDKGEAKFPHKDLQLNNKTIIVDRFSFKN
ncbi:MAG TPA: UDP-N-acetylglucosamine 2-epimerase (non-hydrolyzing) [Methanobacterium sp.]|nr:UDP-N-acetylglucosamine 2-epimerase (non-hydrolyzing) [Methanobacterium sp.]